MRLSRHLTIHVRSPYIQMTDITHDAYHAQQANLVRSCALLACTAILRVAVGRLQLSFQLLDPVLQGLDVLLVCGASPVCLTVVHAFQVVQLAGQAPWSAVASCAPLLSANVAR